MQFFFAVAGGGNGRSLVLVLTELTGMYCISSVLLIRKQLPLQYRCAAASNAWRGVAVKDCRRLACQPA